MRPYRAYNKPMEWIIDGHNLIPHVRGLSLADLDDEQALIELLIQFCRLKHDRAVVFLTGQRLGMPANVALAP